jgi:glutamate decarboxylase
MSRLIGMGYDRAEYLCARLRAHPSFQVISPDPLPCWQVCFYYLPKAGQSASALGKEENTRITQTMAKDLVKKGFMVDYAPGEEGKFFRVVVHANTTRATCDALVKAIEELGASI